MDEEARGVRYRADLLKMLERQEIVKITDFTIDRFFPAPVWSNPAEDLMFVIAGGRPRETRQQIIDFFVTTNNLEYFYSIVDGEHRFRKKAKE